MHTTEFTIEEYLAEYLKGKWGVKNEKEEFLGYIQIPDDVYMYYLLHSITIKRPKHVPPFAGNIKVILPHRREGNKNPEYYNYVSEKSAKLFNKKLKQFFRADLHEFIDHMKHDQGLTYKEACFLFISKYDIESTEVETLIKNYNRWKSTVRKNRQKKAYSTR